MNFIKRRKWLLSGIAVILIVSLLGIKVNINHVVKDGNLTVGQSGVVITIGDSTYASGTVDYTCDGADDDIQFQGALDALPATGGEIQVLTGAYDFANATTVTRAIPNVKITGTGQGSSFTCDGATPIFTAGGNGWTISNIKTDAGGLSMGATTQWSWENVTINATYYAYRTDDATTGVSWNIPTGRVATYIVASTNASPQAQAQADLVVANADTACVAAFAALTVGRTQKETIKFIGTFTITTGTISVPSYTILDLTEAKFTVGNGLYGFYITNKVFVDIIGGHFDGGSNSLVPIFSDGSSEHITIDGTYISNTDDCGIEFNIAAGAMKSISIRNVSMYNTSNAGIICDGTGTADSLIIDNFVINTVRAKANNAFGIWLVGAGWDDSFKSISNGLITNLAATTNGDGLGLRGIDGHVTNVTCSFNLTGDGFAFGNIGLTTTGWTITNCTAHDNVGSGFMLHTSDHNTLLNNVSYSNTQYGINENVGSDNNVFIGNVLYSNGWGEVFRTGANTIIKENVGFIDSGEIRSISGALIPGNANAITFAWNNPNGQDILITKVVIEITQAGGTALSVIQIGLANDATGTGLGSELFSGIDANATAINDSWIAGDTGTQTKLFVCQDNVSATDDWIVGKILTQNAAALVGKYYIFYVGR
jgi:parallel beta-helix repeat protein